MQETLATAIDQLSSCERGLHFTSNTDTQYFLAFYELREQVRSLARKLPVVGGKRGKPAILMVTDHFDFVLGFLAAIRAGVTVVPVAPPTLTEKKDEYATRIERIRRITGSELILTNDSLQEVLRPLLTNARLVALSEFAGIEERGKLTQAQSTDVALIQFTSGSTASPKGVALTHRNLIANAGAIRQALAIDPIRDRGVSWLPMHHDMGLIGFLITPILTQTQITYMPSIEFARRPQRWLDIINETRATISFSPNFGYDLVSRRIRQTNKEQWDLSCWRVAGCGGEPITQRVLNKFSDSLASAKFNRNAFVPSYGLAESTLAVTMSPLRRGMVTRMVNSDAQPDRTLVSSGIPVASTEIRITSELGTPLPDGVEGEIHVRGPGVASSFWDEKGKYSGCNSEGWLNTGDLGMFVRGELHVSGRIKEIIALNGCKYHPHDIERSAQNIAGIRSGSVVAFGRPNDASEELVLLVETNSPTNAASLKRQLRTCIRERLGLNVADIATVSRGTILRTSSGKIQRRAMRAIYLSNFLSA